MEASLELRIWPHHIYCILCGAIMIKKVPKPWQDWEPFWGCRNYDDCKYTRTILPDGRIEPEVYYLDDLRWIFEGKLE